MIYLDYNATTPIDPDVKSDYFRLLEECFGNPSSLHSIGLEAEKLIKKSREKVAFLLDVEPDEVFFTSGATESNNMLIQGLVEANKKKGNHIIVSSIEHESVLSPCKKLESKGVQVTYIQPNNKGNHSIKDIVEQIKKETILVILMAVNNEIGSINPIEELSYLIKKKNPSTLFFSDGTQSLGKQKISLEHIDAFSFSGHKIFAPKGIGGFYLKKNVSFTPPFVGGGQEKGLRPGTENVAAIAAFAKAFEKMEKNLLSNQKHIEEIRSIFLEGVKQIDQVIIHSPQSSIPSTVNLAFLGIPGQVLVHALEEKNIFISTGAACSSNKNKASHVLKELGISKDIANSSVRFSFSHFTTKQEIEKVVTTLQTVVKDLREAIYG